MKLHQTVLLLALLAVQTAGAATITVTNTADSGAGTLRAALASAANGDTINFSLPTPAKLTLVSGELLVTKSVNILGPGTKNLAVDGNHASRVFHIAPSNTVTIGSLAITNGYASGSFPANSGGGIYNDHANLTVSNCALIGNSSARHGGAMANDGGRTNDYGGRGAMLAVVGSMIRSNSAAAGGGGGGGIHNDGGFGKATLAVTNCTLDGNSATEGGAIYNSGALGSGVIWLVNTTLMNNNSGGFGGGILNYLGSQEIANSTFSGNRGASGGAIYNDGSAGNASLRIVNSTLNENRSFGPAAGDGIYNYFCTNVHIGDTILNSHPSGENVHNAFGSITSDGFNLSSDDGVHNFAGGTGSFDAAGDQTNSIPLLGPLQDNGGQTFTHAPLPGSPAIDRGKSFGAVTDQRGSLRTVDKPSFANAPGGDGTDIGAVESESLTVVNPGDAGPGSLRQAILDASVHPGNDLIDFAPSAYGTIRLTSGELVVNSDLIINGPGQANLAVDGNAASRVFRVGSNAVAVLAGLTITNGFAPAGGGIYSDSSTVTVSNCAVSGNSAYVGGGIYIDKGVDVAGMTVINSTVSGNIATNSSFGGVGGGIFNSGSLHLFDCTLRSNSTGILGSSGAICNEAGTVRVRNSSLIGNSAGFGGGGGITSYACCTGSTASVEVVNSTLSGNSAGGEGGSGIFNTADFGDASVKLVNTTLSGGSSPSDVRNGGGGARLQILNSTLHRGNASSLSILGLGIYNVGGSVEIGSTILNGYSLYPSQNRAIFNLSGTVTSLGYNVSSDNGSGLLTKATDQINTDPKLGPLQDNGGPTFTHAFTCRSPAIDAGRNFSASATDQRGAGFARSFDDPAAVDAVGGDVTDIGAFEAQQPLVRCNLPPVADASATPLLIISANGTNATAILDGSRSSDPDGDLLQYSWSESDAPLASGVVAVTVLPVGTHSIQLVVSDGALSDTNVLTIEVITAAEAVNRLTATLGPGVPRPQSLLAALNAALASIDRSHPVSAINQLLALQNQIRAQVEPLDSALAASLIQAAQEIIDALSGGNTNPGGQPHGRFTAVTRQSNGRVRMQFSADATRTHVVEASTNLVNWEMIGVAAPLTGDRFEFEDTQSAKFSRRFYRVVSP